MKRLLILCTSAAYLNACASMSGSMLLGAGTGAALGGGIGHAASGHKPTGNAVGAITGAGFGALIGYLGHKDYEEKERQKNLKTGSLEKPKAPKIVPPKYESIWIPDKIEGDRYIEGHRVHILKSPSTWSTD